jgi:Cu2+-containing amine oxidase
VVVVVVLVDVLVVVLVVEVVEEVVVVVVGATVVVVVVVEGAQEVQVASVKQLVKQAYTNKPVSAVIAVVDLAQIDIIVFDNTGRVIDVPAQSV